MSRILFIIILLMFSCEELLRNEVIDCADVEGGTAFIDDCSQCTGGTTGLLENNLKDDCDVCTNISDYTFDGRNKALPSENNLGYGMDIDSHDDGTSHPIMDLGYGPLVEDTNNNVIDTALWDYDMDFYYHLI